MALHALPPHDTIWCRAVGVLAAPFWLKPLWWRRTASGLAGPSRSEGGSEEVRLLCTNAQRAARGGHDRTIKPRLSRRRVLATTEYRVCMCGWCVWGMGQRGEETICRSGVLNTRVGYFPVVIQRRPTSYTATDLLRWGFVFNACMGSRPPEWRRVMTIIIT